MTSFSVELRTSYVPRILDLHFDEEADSVTSLISDACAGLAAETDAAFIVTGPGDLTWPVDVATDLAVYIEQVPSAVSSLCTDGSATIDFFEQGIERRVAFQTTHEEVVVTCTSLTGHVPPVTGIIARRDLLAMLQESLRTFIESVSLLSPRLAKHPLMIEWMRTTLGADAVEMQLPTPRTSIKDTSALVSHQLPFLTAVECLRRSIRRVFPRAEVRELSVRSGKFRIALEHQKLLFAELSVASAKLFGIDRNDREQRDFLRQLETSYWRETPERVDA